MARTALDAGDAAAVAPTSLASHYSVEVHQISKSFGQNAVLHDVSFRLRKGETVALIGANGCGKSTLLRCCLRLTEPDNGHVVLLGQDIRSLRGGLLRRLRAKVGFIFQKHNLAPRLSVLSNVIHGAQGRFGGPRLRTHTQ